MLPNVPQFAIAYYGILRAGGVVVPMNVLLKEREIGLLPVRLAGQGRVRLARVRRRGQGRRRRGGRRCILVEPGEFERMLGAHAAADRTVEPRDDDDTAVILYTSGTTGTPKGAELTHGNLRAQHRGRPPSCCS